jgi:hypothetical protein
VAVERLYARLNEPEKNGWDNPPPRLNPQQTRQIDLRQLPGRATPLRHTRIVVTVRELDDLLREDVRRELEQLHDTLPVYAIDITTRFSAADCSAPAGMIRRWQAMPAGTTCSKFSAGWPTWAGGDFAYRADHPLRSAAAFFTPRRQSFPPATLASWRFVWHWSPQASEEARQHAWQQQREAAGDTAAAAAGDLASLPGERHWKTLLRSPLLSEASFLACQADANELLDLAQLDSSRLAASENYPVHKLRQIHSALRQRQLSLAVWLLSWNTLTGDTRDTNGRFFAARC